MENDKLHDLINRPFSIKLEESVLVIRKWSSHSVVSWSGGKDSTVILYLALREIRDIPVIFMKYELLFPETLSFIWRIREKWQIENLHILSSKYSPWCIPPSFNKFPPCAYWFKIEPSLRFLRNRKKSCVFLGDRAEEHPEKFLLNEDIVQRRSIERITAIYPLAYWKEREVYSFIHERKIPLNSLYSMGYKVQAFCCPRHWSVEDIRRFAETHRTIYTFLLKKTSTKNAQELREYLRNKLLLGRGEA